MQIDPVKIKINSESNYKLIENIEPFCGKLCSDCSKQFNTNVKSIPYYLKWVVEFKINSFFTIWKNILRTPRICYSEPPPPLLKCKSMSPKKTVSSSSNGKVCLTHYQQAIFCNNLSILIPLWGGGQGDVLQPWDCLATHWQLTDN